MSRAILAGQCKNEHAERLREAREELGALFLELPDDVRARVVVGAERFGRRHRRYGLHAQLEASFRQLERHAIAEGDPASLDRLARSRRLMAEIERARSRMVLDNLHLVRQAVRRFPSTAIPVVDLVQEGYVGLLQAVDRFDPTRGIPFAGYAMWWIRRAVLEAFSQRSRLIRLPESLRGELRRMRRSAQDLEDRLGRQPDTDEIAQGMAAPLRKVRKLIRVTADPTSVEEMEGEDAVDGAAPALDPLQVTLANEIERHAHEALAQLGPREREILQLRFGFDGGEDRSLTETGAAVGLSRERVRQIEHGALGKIRAWAADRGLRTEPSRRANPQGVQAEFG
jgi:RNA polymerase sigma factor (sigma-70 family)